MEDAGDLKRLAGSPERKRKYDPSEPEDGKKTRVGIAAAAVALNFFVFLKQSLAAVASENDSSGTNTRAISNTAALPVDDAELGSLTERDAETAAPDENLEATLAESDHNIANVFAGTGRFFNLNDQTSRDLDIATAPSIAGLAAGNDNPVSGSSSHQPFITLDAIVTPAAPHAGSRGGGSGVSARISDESVVVDDNDTDHDGTTDQDGEQHGDDNAAPNRSPVVVSSVVLPSLWLNQALIVTTAQLLYGAADPDGDTLSVYGLHSDGGTLTQLREGVWEFKAVEDFTGQLTFTYAVSDGHEAAPQTALLEFSDLPTAPIAEAGTGSTILGTVGSDLIGLGPGDYVVVARGGDDIVIGRDGDDRIVGGDGDDDLFGGAGDDVIFGGAGDDTIFAGGGDDQVFGDQGSDQLYGEDGDDEIDGGDGDDLVDGGTGEDLVAGGQGNDVLYGGADNDTLAGGSGRDILIGGSGDDQATGGMDDDTFIAFAGDGDDTYDGGDGDDTYDFSGTYADALVDLAANVAQSGDIGLDQLQNIESVSAGQGNDHITGDVAANQIDGNAGDDEIAAGAGEDTVSGGDGNDVLIGEAGDGDDRYSGDSGDDTYDFSGTYADALVDLANNFAESSEIGFDSLSEIENVTAGQGDDLLIGDSQANVIDGSDGADRIYGDDGDDDLVGGAGEDYVSGGAGDDRLRASLDDGDDEYDGGDGEDTYDLSSLMTACIVDLSDGTARGEDIGTDYLENIENIIGSAAGDVLTGDDRGNYLRGSDGFDFISGAGGNDRLRGEDGDDVLNGGDGNDRLEGGDGDDTLAGGRGRDVADGGDGDDVFVATVGDGDDFYSGGDGTDTYDLSNAAADAVIDLNVGTALSADIGQDRIDGFENARGGSGNDRFIANDQVNVFSGGAGADTFVFEQNASSASGRFWRDFIEDFELGDVIDVSFIDADEDEDDDQDFEFVLDSNAAIQPGQLTVRYDFDDDDGGDIRTVLSGFTDNDHLADFEIVLYGEHQVTMASLYGVHAAA